ncbi:hypothetical protein [Falsiroseomonas oryziterrae]|uniref:hypothetical protein n=1 Tax=Falsiroseomonas oryziterrae TaxID=2911368 RepID=UPI001F42AD11|nr:hypothetical protein [Roseomonas sp. NPKOSM-4]
MSEHSSASINPAEPQLSYADQIARLAEQAAANGQTYASALLRRTSELLDAALRKAN